MVWFFAMYNRKLVWKKNVFYFFIILSHKQKTRKITKKCFVEFLSTPIIKINQQGIFLTSCQKIYTQKKWVKHFQPKNEFSNLNVQIFLIFFSFLCTVRLCANVLYCVLYINFCDCTYRYACILHVWMAYFVLYFVTHWGIVFGGVSYSIWN